MSELIQHSNSIEWRFERQTLRIEPWGKIACASGPPARPRLMTPCRRCCPQHLARQRLPPKQKA